MRLADVAEVRTGLTLRERMVQSPSRGILCVQQGDLSETGDFDRNGAARIAAPTFSPKYLARDGEVVFRSRGPFWSAWAVSGLSEPLMAIAPLFIIHPTADIDAGFLAWSLGRPAAQRYFAAEAMGTGVKMITRSVLQAVELELPPVDVQRDIAAIAPLASTELDLEERLARLRHTLVSARLDQLTARASATTPDRKTR